MPFKVAPKQFTSWSNSRWNDYNECPAKANYLHLQKLPTPKSPQMDRGIEIAEKEEAYFKGPARMKVPAEIHKDLHPEFKRIKAIGKNFLLVEEQWGFTKDWQVADWFDWKNCWLRVKVDVGYSEERGTIIHLYDNKTGGLDKKTGKLRLTDREKYEEQLDLYTAAAAARFPESKQYLTKLIYTDLGVMYPFEGPKVTLRAAAIKLQDKWTKRVKPMFADKNFLPRPGYYCIWCHFRKSNGGPCKF